MIVFCKIQKDFYLDIPSNHPTLVQICMEIGKDITFNETRDFFRTHEKSHGYMAHTFVVAISNIFTVMMKAAKHLEALCRMKYPNEVDPNIG